MTTRDSVWGIDRYLERWRLRDAELVAKTETCQVYRVLRKKGGHAALKVVRPRSDPFEKSGLETLAWYAGRGAAEVYAFGDGALLMEWLEGPPLSDLVLQGKDEVATDIICQVVTQLHMERSRTPISLISLENHFRGLFAADRHKWPSAGGDLLIRAQLIARTMLDSTGQEIVLHGDLHHDNILFSPRSWVAIDPKGLFGDPAYEVANCFLNPWGEADICAAPSRIDSMADRFAMRLETDRRRILGFAVAHGALSSSWANEAGTLPNHQITVLPNLISAYERAGGRMR